MRILVDEMPKEPKDCPYCKDESTMDFDKYTCTYRKEHQCYCTDGDMGYCPYFVTFKIIFDNSISDYHIEEKDPYRYG